MTLYILIITLTSTIGIQHPVVLHGDTPQYASYGECQQAGEHVTDWLTQDHIRVVYECRPIVVQEEDCAGSFTDTCVGCTDDCLEPNKED